MPRVPRTLGAPIASRGMGALCAPAVGRAGGVDVGGHRSPSRPWGRNIQFPAHRFGSPVMDLADS